MSLRARVALAAAGVAALVLVVAGILVVRLTERDQRAALDSAIRSQARTVAAPLSRLAVSSVAPIIQRSATPGVDGDRTLRVLLPSGTPLLSLGQSLPAALNRLPVGIDTIRLGGTDYASYAVDVPRRGIQVQVIAPLAPIQAQARRVRNRVLVIGAVAIAATLCLAYLTASAGLVSLARLRRRVDDVAATEDLTQRMPVEGPVEISSVSKAFNALLTRLQRSTAERQQALDTARGFAADAAHELRTPLTSMGANLGQLDGADPAVVAALHDDHARLVATLEALHALTVGELIPASDEPVDLADLLEIIGREHHRHPGLALAVDTPPEPVIVNGDREGLRLLVDNLLTNAERHARTSGSDPAHVTMTVRRDGVAWLVTIDDDGPGWPPRDRTTLLQRFVRGPDPAVPGSGLGLAIADQQARRHGGCLTLADAPTGGARVVLHLPAAT